MRAGSNWRHLNGLSLGMMGDPVRCLPKVVHPDVAALKLQHNQCGNVTAHGAPGHLRPFCYVLDRGVADSLDTQTGEVGEGDPHRALRRLVPSELHAARRRHECAITLDLFGCTASVNDASRPHRERALRLGVGYLGASNGGEIWCYNLDVLLHGLGASNTRPHFKNHASDQSPGRWSVRPRVSLSPWTPTRRRARLASLLSALKAPSRRATVDGCRQRCTILRQLGGATNSRSVFAVHDSPDSALARLRLSSSTSRARPSRRPCH